MTVAVEGKVPCQFPHVLLFALLLKTIPQSQATSERSGRQLRDWEDPRRSQLSCKRGARAILIGECGPPLVDVQLLIDCAQRRRRIIRWAALVDGSVRH